VSSALSTKNGQVEQPGSTARVVSQEGKAKANTPWLNGVAELSFNAAAELKQALQ
jgi:hypothetical protein